MHLPCDTEREIRALSKAAGALRPAKRDEIRLMCSRHLMLLEVSGCSSMTELLELAKRAAELPRLEQETERLRAEIEENRRK